MSLQQQIIDLIKASQKILIMPSSPPDGDSIGSALALTIALKKLGKEVTVVCPESVPDTYHFLPSTSIIGDHVVASKDFVITIDTQNIKIANIKQIDENQKVNLIITPVNGRLTQDQISFNYGPERYDLIITVDTGGVEQLGHLYSDHVEMFHQIPVINIDHHFSNEHFGRINFVDVMAPSTTELLIGLLELMEKDSGIKLIDEDIATLLLAGIITDTGSFQNANTSPRAFDGSAKLVQYGARQQEIIQHIFKTKQLSMLKLWGRILTKMQTDEKYNIVWSVLTRKDFYDTAADDSETGGIIDELLTNAPGSEIVFLLKERKDGTITCSIRSTTSAIDSSALAEKFGGGGHVQAAGFRMKGISVEKLEQDILREFRAYQAYRLGKPQEHSDTLKSMQPSASPLEKPLEIQPKKEPLEIEAKPEPLEIEPPKVAEPKPDIAPQPTVVPPPGFQFQPPVAIPQETVQSPTNFNFQPPQNGTPAAISQPENSPPEPQTPQYTFGAK